MSSQSQKVYRSYKIKQKHQNTKPK